jgi:hypothetical protein
MIRVGCAFTFMLELLASMVIAQAIFTSNDITNTATAQSLNRLPERIETSRNQTMDSNDTRNLEPYSNPNLGFSLQYPAEWQKEESLTFISPQGGVGNRGPEAISITTELLPTSNYTLDRYTEAGLGQVESFQDFKLLNSSSTLLAGLPAHMIVYSFTDENLTPLQNLQAWTVKDGMAYVITYGGTPEEFESSLPVLNGVMDSFRFER